MQKITILGLAVAISMMSCTVSVAEAGPIPSPYQQVRDGTPTGEVMCAGDRMLMLSPSGIPACVFAGSVEVLERRGFVLLSEVPRDDLSAKQPRASEKAGGTGSPDASKTGDRPFVTTWRTASPNESITILVRGSTGAYTVDWGDGTATSVTGDASHAYASPGEHQVVISGNFTGIYLNGRPNAEKLQSIDQWGDIQWESMNWVFWGATNMVYRATDVPDLSGVTGMYAMFDYATSFNGDIAPWDVSGVTDMSYMFLDASSFNSDLSPWDVSGVTRMSGMFAGAESFNGDISPWDVSGVTDMSGMFVGADAFDQNLGKWYIVLGDRSIDDGDASRIVTSISAQNAFLDDQSLRYSIAPGGDGDAFEIDGTVLKLKSTPNYTNKSSYTVTISSTGEFGTSNSETFEIRVV